MFTYTFYIENKNICFQTDDECVLFSMDVASVHPPTLVGGFCVSQETRDISATVM